MRKVGLFFSLSLAVTLVAAAGEPTQEVRDVAGRQVWRLYLEAQTLAAEGLESGDSRRIAQAVVALRETIRLDPTAAEPHVDLGNLYLFGNGDLSLAASEAREAIRLSPESVDGHLLLGRLACLALRQKDGTEDGRREREGAADTPAAIPPELYEPVIAAYRRVAELDPLQSEAWLILQSAYEARQQFDDQMIALERFLVAPPVGPENIFVQRLVSPPFTPDQAWFKLSLLYLRRGRYESALGAARRAYEAEPESESYEEHLFELLGLAPSREAEVQGIRQVIEVAGQPRLRLRYADALVRAGREADALQVLRDWPDAPPGVDVARKVSITATAQRRLNRRAEALETLGQGIAATRDEIRLGLEFEFAETLEELGRNREAIARYERLCDQILRLGTVVTSSSPLLDRTIERLAGLHQRTGNQVRLQRLLTRIRRVLDEQNPLLDRISVRSLTAEGRLAEALTVVRAAARRYRHDLSWLISESSLLAELGQFSESLQLIESLIIGTPESAGEDSGLHLELAAIHERQGDLARALAAVGKAIELCSPDPRLRDQLISARLMAASIIYRQGRPAESIRLLREILLLEPADATALNNLGYFLAEEGQTLEEARQLVERAVAIDPLNGSYLDSLGWVIFRLGKSREALPVLEKAFQLSPRSAAINEHLGEVLLTLGRVAEARRFWEKALGYSDSPDQQDRLRRRLK